MGPAALGVQRTGPALPPRSGLVLNRGADVFYEAFCPTAELRGARPAALMLCLGWLKRVTSVPPQTSSSSAERVLRAHQGLAVSAKTLFKQSCTPCTSHASHIWLQGQLEPCLVPAVCPACPRGCAEHDNKEPSMETP